MAHYQYKQEDVAEGVAYASCKRKVVKLLKPTNEASQDGARCFSHCRIPNSGAGNSQHFPRARFRSRSRSHSHTPNHEPVTSLTNCTWAPDFLLPHQKKKKNFPVLTNKQVPVRAPISFHMAKTKANKN